jgi:hypothetical protein
MSTQRVLNAGIDTLYLNAYYADPQTFGRLNQPLDPDLQDFFTTLQQQARNARHETETPWSLDSKPLYMLSHGSGKVWHWIIKNDDINIQIGNGDYRGIIAHARIASQYLWGVGALHYLTPSEIDLCVDVANWPASELDRSRFIAKARKGKVEFDEDSLMVGAKRVEYSGPKQDTFYIGKRKSPVHGRVYDKLKEIKDHQYDKAWYLDILKERCGWDGQEPVTRTEITTKREALRDMGIETLTDLENNIKSLWGYLVGTDEKEGWSRYAVPLVNELTGHVDMQRQRWPAHPTWNLIKRAFDSLSQEPARELIRVRRQRVHLDANTASIAGYLTSRTVFLCDKNEVPIEKIALKTAVDDLLEDIEKLLKDKGVSFQELLQVKQHRYYLRKAATREADMRGVQSFLHSDNDDQETIEERI